MHARDWACSRMFVSWLAVSLAFFVVRHQRGRSKLPLEGGNGRVGRVVLSSCACLNRRPLVRSASQYKSSTACASQTSSRESGDVNNAQEEHVGAVSCGPTRCGKSVVVVHRYVLASVDVYTLNIGPTCTETRALTPLIPLLFCTVLL